MLSELHVFKTRSNLSDQLHRRAQLVWASRSIIRKRVCDVTIQTLLSCMAEATVFFVICVSGLFGILTKFFHGKTVWTTKFHHGDPLASLASSGESDDGGLAPPPRKKSRTSLEVTMQQPANGCSQHNGATEDHIPSSSNQQNGTDIGSENNAINGDILPKRLDKTDYEIVRLIGQHLKTIGLQWVIYFSLSLLNKPNSKIRLIIISSFINFTFVSISWFIANNDFQLKQARAVPQLFLFYLITKISMFRGRWLLNMSVINILTKFSFVN